jgi:hypothetical protein
VLLCYTFFRFWYHVPIEIWQPWSTANTIFKRQSFGDILCGQKSETLPGHHERGGTYGEIRVTRLSEISHVGPLLTLNSFVKIPEVIIIFGLCTFSTVKVLYQFCKKWVGLHFRTFFYKLDYILCHFSQFGLHFVPFFTIWTTFCAIFHKFIWSH